MLKKKEIINILVDHGVSIIESDRLTNNKETFNEAIKDIKDKVLMDYSTIELSNKAIEEVVNKWAKEQDKPEPDIFGVSKIIIGKKQLQNLIKMLKEKKE